MYVLYLTVYFWIFWR